MRSIIPASPSSASRSMVMTAGFALPAISAPRPSSRVRDLPKLFEDSCDVGFGDADTGVAHGYANAIRPGALGGNLYFPFPRELDRVREQVDKNLLKLRSIGAHRRQPVFGIETELDGASFLERFDDRQSALDQVACVRRL